MGKPQISQNTIKELLELRQTGHSIPEIHKILKISKSTVSRYCKDVQILPEFESRWLDRRNASKIISEKAWNKANKTAVDVVDSVNEKELKLLGAALYWAEGAKREFSFINSDPEMVRLFLYILIKSFKIPADSIKISLRLFEDIAIPKALEFWSEVTKIKIDKQTEINVIKGSKKGRLPFGMCRIKVKKGGLLLKTIVAINKRVSEVISS